MIYISSELLFIKLFTTSKTFLILTCLNINLESLIIGCNQGRYVSRDTCSESLPPLGKSSASLGKGWMESTWRLMAWHSSL